MLENELKRNLDAVYDVDLCSSQSSTKPRMGDCENNEDPPIYLEDQTINLEGMLFYSVVYVVYIFNLRD
ncbi:hypothetical protein HanXRQr2_Chr01g0000421 [Helianthus annuus]|uniref:Uncharacterized protein n=1 Tax=Helianthus annuus TaxID=4232 RepID=A0A9K3JSN8_HELAN|nr:hypothetical protein HanXRQr2_Chr03g0137491 [Helianthus annuus]KAF5820278.1 hypothetical protein HanXRQr2_Chr01g0000421 [Helianthus annuus]KAJ0945980.1 hypothetical protein HanPSC8_Chr03g0134131 [Helianthus annuus]